ncbi:mucin-binding protein [Limosilactobacillus mucosae]
MAGNWQLATGESLPQNVQLAAVDTPIVIQIVAGLCTISTATAAGTLIPETKNQHLQKAIADDDLNRQVIQTVVIINPLDHTSVTQQQIVLFTRSAVINMTNGKLDHYTDWQSEGTDYFNEVTLPTFTGYNFRREDTRTCSGDESPRQSTEKVLFIWLSFPMVV